MFKKDEYVVYGDHGVCIYIDKIEKVVNEKTMYYYMFKSYYDQEAIIYLPCTNAELLKKVRLLTSKQELKEIIDIVSHEDSNWITNNSKRKEEYNRILSENNQLDTLRLIKTIYMHKHDNPTIEINYADEVTFKKAKTKLFNELAITLDTKPDDVITYIEKMFEECLDKKIN